VIIFSFKGDSNLFLEKLASRYMVSGEMPRYLVEIILVVDAKDFEEARKIADHIIDVPIPDSTAENAIESLRVEEIVQIKNQKSG
jgi:hypothetical protein